MSASSNKPARSTRKTARRTTTAKTRRPRARKNSRAEAEANAAESTDVVSDDGEENDASESEQVSEEALQDAEFEESAEAQAEASQEAETNGKPARKTKKKKESDDRASFLAMYFREMAALDVLRPEEEFEAARQIEALEIGIWVTLLSHAPAADYVLQHVETCMENSIPEFKSVRRAAATARKSSVKANLAKLEKSAEKCAEKLRALDTDRQYLDAVIADLHRIVRDVPGRAAPQKLPFVPTSKAFTSYLKRVRTADRHAAMARNAFVKANLRLVVSIARRFNHGRMALADLIQEGNIGLMKAVERYDYRRGFRFSTYASWWIRHAISRALADKGREVRLPVHMIDAYHRLSKAKRELTAKLGRQPNTEELAEATNLPGTKIEKMRTYLVDQSFSLDRPVNDEDGRHFIEFLQDPATEENDPADKLSLQAMTREVKSLLHDLKPIEADILRQRFGLIDDRELTLKEIGEKYNLSRERIRQLQEQALGKMRRALARKEML